MSNIVLLYGNTPLKVLQPSTFTMALQQACWGLPDALQNGQARLWTYPHPNTLPEVQRIIARALQASCLLPCQEYTFG